MQGLGKGRRTWVKEVLSRDMRGRQGIVGCVGAEVGAHGAVAWDDEVLRHHFILSSGEIRQKD